MRQHTQPSVTELHTFCDTCPSPQDVTALLSQMGFQLDFQMEEQRDHRSQLPPLPAQFHFKDAHGIEVIYLAGRDAPLNEDGEGLPPHASRFWLYAGAQPEMFQFTMTSLALAFQLTWCDPVEPEAAQQEVA